LQKVIRVTLALPRDLWETVKCSIPAGQRSGLVAKAIEKELRHRKRLEQLERLRQFQDYMRDKHGEFPAGALDIEQMREERDSNAQ